LPFGCVAGCCADSGYPTADAAADGSQSAGGNVSRNAPDGVASAAFWGGCWLSEGMFSGSIIHRWFCFSGLRGSAQL